MMQALAEMSVLYPINGAFTMYICRFVDPSFGFACAWEYAISWLTVLPYEISAAVNIIHYWEGSQHINSAAWIVPLLVALVSFNRLKHGTSTELISTIGYHSVLRCARLC